MAGVEVLADDGVLPGPLVVKETSDPSQVAGLVTGPVVNVTAGGQPDGELEVVFTDPGEGGLVAYYDETLELWLPVPTERRSDGALVGTLDHLTLIAPVRSWLSNRADDVREAGRAVSRTVGSGATWLQAQTGQLTDNRAEPPDCDGRPDWVGSFAAATNPNAQLLACATTGPDGRLHVQVVNNRGFPQVVAVEGHLVEMLGTSLSSELGPFINQLANVGVTSGQTTLVPALQTTTFAQARPAEGQATNTEVYARSDLSSLLAWLVMEMALAVGGDFPLPGGGTLAGEAAQCVVDALDAAGALPGGDLEVGTLVQVGDSWLSCLQGAVAQTVAAAGDGQLTDGLVALDRLLLAFNVADYTQSLADLVYNDSTPDADLVDVGWAARGERQGPRSPDELAEWILSAWTAGEGDRVSVAMSDRAVADLRAVEDMLPRTADGVRFVLTASNCDEAGSCSLLFAGPDQTSCCGVFTSGRWESQGEVLYLESLERRWESAG